MSNSLEREIKKAVDLAFHRKEPVILAEEIASNLMPRLLWAVQREIDSRFQKRKRIDDDEPSPRAARSNRKRGSR